MISPLRKIRRALRHSTSAIRAHFWEESISDDYCSSSCGGRDEQESLFLIRQCLRRLVPPETRQARLAYMESVAGRHHAEMVCRAADAIGVHHIALFGSVYDLGKEIDWSRDPVSGHQWPSIPSYRINLWNTAGQADIRPVWELSAFRHAVVLGQAYWLTQDEKYSREFMDQVRHWATRNPFNRGANWLCAMMVAIRAVNILWAYAFLADSPVLDGAAHRFLYNLLRLHGVYIFNNLENTSSIRGNHYLANLAGLIHLGCMLPVASEARKWFDFAVSELHREVGLQVLSDGLNFEGSLPYHGLVVEMLLHTAIIAGKLGRPHRLLLDDAEESALPLRQRSALALGDGFVDTVERMMEATAGYITPSGVVPQIGDNDGSRWVVLGDKRGAKSSHLHLFAVAGGFFGRDDFRQIGAPARMEALWLFDEIPPSSHTLGWSPHSHLFRPSGLCTMRNGTDYLIIRCGSLGTSGKGTHTHNDNLSFELCAQGTMFFVDPGSYTYLRDPELREMFRATAYHNTVRIDGREQHRSCSRDVFQLFPASEASILVWETNEETDIFRGQVRIPQPEEEDIIHQREFRYHKINHSWIITDEVQGTGSHVLEWFFHLDPAVSVEFNENSIILHSGIRGAVTFAGDLIGHNTVALQEGWFSPNYGLKEKSSVLCIRRNEMLPFRTRWSITTGTRAGDMSANAHGKQCMSRNSGASEMERL